MELLPTTEVILAAKSTISVLFSSFLDKGRLVSEWAARNCMGGQIQRNTTLRVAKEWQSDATNAMPFS
jgi:hypothetical protein